VTATAIGIDGSSYVASPTGAMRRTRELTIHLAELGWRPILFLPRHSCEFFANTPDLEIVPIDIHSRPGPWRARLAEKLLPDLLAKNDCRLLLTETHAFPANLPTVFTVHDLAAWDVPELCSFKRKWWRRLTVPTALRKAAAVLTVSDFSAQRLSHHFPDIRATVASNGANHLPALARKTPADRFVLLVGPNDNFRNWPVVIEAIEGLRSTDEFSDLKLVLAGGSNTGQLPPWANNQIVDDHALAVLYSTATALVCESRYEGFDLPLAEALHAACPVVASDLAVHRQIAGEAAIYFTSGNKDELGEAIKKLALNPPDAAQLNHQVDSLSWESSAEIVDQVLFAALRRAT